MPILKEYQDSFEDKEYFEIPSAKELRETAGYNVASNFGNDVEAGEEWVEEAIEAKKNLNSFLNGTVSLFGGIKKAPKPALVELGSEVVEETANMTAALISKAGIINCCECKGDDFEI